MIKVTDIDFVFEIVTGTEEREVSSLQTDATGRQFMVPERRPFPVYAQRSLTIPNVPHDQVMQHTEAALLERARDEHGAGVRAVSTTHRVRIINDDEA